MCQSLYIKNIKFESITNYFSILSFVHFESDTEITTSRANSILQINTDDLLQANHII